MKKTKVRIMNKKDNKDAIKSYINERKPNNRYASFDYCYNYFYNFYKSNSLKKLANDENLEQSCLQLGFYLASWGMMRGSTFMLKKYSSRNLGKLIKAISEMKRKLWEIDVDSYDEGNIKLLLECKEKIKVALGKNNNPSDTLVTKIMLGVFANVPAFDQNFKKAMKAYKFDEKSLGKIKELYDKNEKLFESFKIRTIDFKTGKETDIRYTNAKLIDMAGFEHGKKLIERKKGKRKKKEIRTVNAPSIHL